MRQIVLALSLLAFFIESAICAQECTNLDISSEWGEGYDGFLNFQLDHSTDGWVVTLTFDTAITNLDCWQGTVATTDNIVFTITNLEWDADYEDGKQVSFHFQPHYSTRPNLIAADIDGQNICEGGSGTTNRPTTPKPVTTAKPTTSWPVTTTPADNNCMDVVDIGDDDGTTTDVSVSLTPTTDIESWTVDIAFETSIVALSTPLADVTGSGTKWTLKNKSFDGSLPAGETFVLSFFVNHGGNGLPGFKDVVFNDDSICGSTTPTPGGDCSEVISSNVNNGPDTDLSIVLAPETTVESWKVKITFSTSVEKVSSPLADISGSGNVWVLSSKSWDGNINAGDTLEVSMNIKHGSNGAPSVDDIEFNDISICGGMPPTPTPSPSVDCSEIITNNQDNGGDTDLSVALTPEKTVESWDIEITFSAAVDKVTSPLAEVSGSGRIWVLSNKSWDGTINAGDTFELSMNIVHGNNGAPTVEEIAFNDVSICTSTAPTTNKPQTTTDSDSGYTPDHPAKYQYNEVLEKTLLFYEAQRSGPLPSSNRVPWRGNSGMSDEVLGGYHDAGDHVKFGFPMASFTTVLAWSGINFKSGYDKAGQSEYLVECLKWSTDYFIGCHKSDYEFIGQIGDGYADHAYWGRPEEMTMARPAYKITASKPGSELAGETAAALASSSIFFRNMGYADYADECLQHARKLFEFADKYRGKYTDAIPVSDFYNDFGGYNDELAWAAAWIAMATKDSSDIAKAEDMYKEVSMGTASPSEVSWDDKSAMVFLVMYELTGKAEYKRKAEEFANFIKSCDRTGKGLIWISSSQWGSLRYAANFAMYATQLVRNDIMADEMFDFAESQINYILGDTGRSYLVGFGNNYPQKAHHRAASCPDRPAQCDWSNKDSPNPNPQVINGALVGGPDRGDNYVDDRNRFEMTEVADDYNAGFQAAVAGLNTFFK